MGAKIVDKDLGAIDFFKRVGQLKLDDLRVGVLSDEKVEGEDFTLAELAAVHEYGSEDGRIPARSFLRSTFDDRREQLVSSFDKLLRLYVAGKMPLEQMLGLIGAQMAAWVKARIVARIPPPNTPRTIEKKGSDKPLIDTGRLLNAVTWSVKKSDD